MSYDTLVWGLKGHWDSMNGCGCGCKRKVCVHDPWLVIEYMAISAESKTQWELTWEFTARMVLMETSSSISGRTMSCSCVVWAIVSAGTGGISETVGLCEMYSILSAIQSGSCPGKEITDRFYSTSRENGCQLWDLTANTKDSWRSISEARIFAACEDMNVHVLGVIKRHICLFNWYRHICLRLRPKLQPFSSYYPCYLLKISFVGMRPGLVTGFVDCHKISTK